MTLQESIVAVAVHLGIVDEDSINNMSLNFFNSVVRQLGKKVNYDAIVNYAGNSFAKDAWKMIQDSNPLKPDRKSPHSSGFMDMIKSIKIGNISDLPQELRD